MDDRECQLGAKVLATSSVHPVPYTVPALVLWDRGTPLAVEPVALGSDAVVAELTNSAEDIVR